MMMIETKFSFSLKKSSNEVPKKKSLNDILQIDSFE